MPDSLGGAALGVEISAGLNDSGEMSLHTNINSVALVLGVQGESGGVRDGKTTPLKACPRGCWERGTREDVYCLKYSPTGHLGVRADSRARLLPGHMNQLCTVRELFVASLQRGHVLPGRSRG